jgi:rod shape-determining protein MreC
LNLPHNAANRIKLAIGSLFIPGFGVSKSAKQLLGNAGDALVSRSELLRQNEQYRQVNQQLQIRAMQADALQRENDQLRQLLGSERQFPWKLKLANVIARDPANWWHDIQIDIGSHDGIRVDMPVMTPAGLVGRVSAVGLTSSQVVLIGSQECKVAALVDKTGDNGVITSFSSPLDNSLVTMSFLSSNSSLKPGQRVITWGEGNIFPKGILIGEIVEDPHQAELGYNEARVKLAANLGALEEVWVVMR